MKIDRLETHDRYLHLLQEQSVNIFLGVEECLRKNPLSLAIQEKVPYVYIYAHSKTDGSRRKMYWQPRLSIPEAAPNSYLFRATSHTDNIEICWIIPPKEFWPQYSKGNVVQSEIIDWSIRMYKCRRLELEKPHADDLSEEQARVVMKQIIEEHRQTLKGSKVIMQETLAASEGSSSELQSDPECPL